MIKDPVMTNKVTQSRGLLTVLYKISFSDEKRDKTQSSQDFHATEIMMSVDSQN